MKVRWLLVCMVGLWGALSPSLLLAQEKKIVVLDVQRAILGTEVAKERLKALGEQEEFEEQRTSLQQNLEEFRGLQKTLEEEAAIMGSQRLEATQKKMQGLREDIQYLRKKMRDQQSELFDALLEEFRPQVGDIVEQMVREDNIGMIVDQQVAFYADAEFDITDKVTEKLNLDQ